MLRERLAEALIGERAAQTTRRQRDTSTFSKT
jgi:hypothetical protein